jgi:hypothetical protein
MSKRLIFRQIDGKVPPHAQGDFVRNTGRIRQERADIYALLQSMPQPPPANSIPLLNK